MDDIEDYLMGNLNTVIQSDDFEWADCYSHTINCRDCDPFVVPYYLSDETLRCECCGRLVDYERGGEE